MNCMAQNTFLACLSLMVMIFSFNVFPFSVSHVQEFVGQFKSRPIIVSVRTQGKESNGRATVKTCKHLD